LYAHKSFLGNISATFYKIVLFPSTDPNNWIVLSNFIIIDSSGYT